MHLNIEIKARCIDQDSIRNWLKDHHADFKGIDHQIDTYFNVAKGRLKLREGNIEHSLIYYERNDQAGPKESKVHLYRPQPDPALKAVLEASLGVWKVVDKHREIAFIENVKFHLDRVEGLGTFVEIEAIDVDGTIGKSKLLEQCTFYMERFGLVEEDLLEVSYSDLV
ncbi:MAG: class IV adenylate cyclase [Bacteroidia bacterium]